MTGSMTTASRTSVLGEVVGDVVRTVGALAVGLTAIASLSVWHRATSSVGGSRGNRADGDGPQSIGGDRAVDPGGTDGSDPDVVEHELAWYHYVKAFDAHHGPGGSSDREPASGSFLRGLRIWIGTRFLRGYTLDDEVYVCPDAPRILRVHQAGHAPAFGHDCDTLVRPRRGNGGLDDEPLHTLDVMMPGDFPHTLLRLRDPRGLCERYDEWLAEGRIARVAG